ncbi:TspO and MBR related proteins [Geodermatophilus siccatus]|uniref:TspO and MBR related proteins n=1 Tax=Geodermatophilus siccatus TaxID=1137991 RepID=A0A1G9N9N8_9ACTN|nr:TspO and MBR related proteins [Geodermatophilus siccatus]
MVGNASIGRDSLRWFQDLRRPALQLPMAAFYAVGGAYYLLMGVVVHRSVTRGDRRSYRLAMAVLAANELWNATFFGRRSTRNGFLGLLAFLCPLGLLQISIIEDRRSSLTLGAYTAYVIGYDLPWTYRLWRLNPAPAERSAPSRPMPGCTSRWTVGVLVPLLCRGTWGPGTAVTVIGALDPGTRRRRPRG